MRERSGAVFAKWRGLVSEQQLSGQSVAAFCRERGLCAPHMFSWKKRLREAEANRFLEAHVFDAVGPAQGVHSAAIEIRLSRSRSLVVEPGFDADHLRAVLAVLESGS